jgi:hypothetical protein
MAGKRLAGKLHSTCSRTGTDIGCLYARVFIVIKCQFKSVEGWLNKNIKPLILLEKVFLDVRRFENNFNIDSLFIR